MDPRDVRRILRAQPRHSTRHLIRKTATLQRCAVLQSINATVFAAASVNVDVGVAGRHNVYAKAFGGENLSIAAFEGVRCMLNAPELILAKVKRCS